MNMKKSMMIMLFAVGLFAAGSFLSGCSKSTTNADTSAMEDQAYADNTYTDVDNIGSEAIQNSGAHKSGGTWLYINVGCASITVDSAVMGVTTVTVDFGTTGCVCRDGRTRTGKIIITYNGRYRDAGTVITYTLSNYTVDGNKVEGSKTVTNMGPNTNGQPRWHVVVTGGKITKTDGTSATYSSDRIRTWSKGYLTADVADDEYLLDNGNNTVTDQGVNFKGQSYTVTITKTLHIVVACTWHIESGTLAFTAGSNTASIDFGDDTCNDLLSVTLNGKTYNNIKRR